MSKILFVAKKNENLNEKEFLRIKNTCDSLNADNINAKPTQTLKDNQIGIGIMNPVQDFRTTGVSVLFGQLFGENKKWYEVGNKFPDGNYALFRSNQTEIEVVADILGTKSIWYYHDQTTFIASTSQRAIVTYLGSFRFNQKVIPWMLTNGLLGPNLSWDKRISLLNVNSSLLLNRETWKFKISAEETEFSPNKLTDKENVRLLRKTLEDTFTNLKLDYTKWRLSLSGGFDSRANFCLLPQKDLNGNKLKTITWGTEDSVQNKGTDVYIAKRLARKKDTDHDFTRTEGSNSSLDTILDRFFRNGEGRIDHITGYMDGFNMWKKLFEENITGIIRGDEVFGSYKFISNFHLKKFIGLSVFSDYTNLKDNSYIKNIGQEFPVVYKKRNKETWEQWRDRLYQSYYTPICLSALADLKENYIDQLNPLLSRKVIAQIRQMPDSLRTDKKAFRAIVNSISPKLPYAYKSPPNAVKNLFSQVKMQEIIKKEMDSDLAKSIFSNEFLDSLAFKAEIKSKNNTDRWMVNIFSYIKSIIPKRIKRWIIKGHYSKNIDMNRVAFRAFLIVSMVKILNKDAALI